MFGTDRHLVEDKSIVAAAMCETYSKLTAKFLNSNKNYFIVDFVQILQVVQISQSIVILDFAQLPQLHRSINWAWFGKIHIEKIVIYCCWKPEKISQICYQNIRISTSYLTITVLLQNFFKVQIGNFLAFNI